MNQCFLRLPYIAFHYCLKLICCMLNCLSALQGVILLAKLLSCSRISFFSVSINRIFNWSPPRTTCWKDLTTSSSLFCVFKMARARRTRRIPTRIITWIHVRSSIGRTLIFKPATTGSRSLAAAAVVALIFQEAIWFQAKEPHRSIWGAVQAVKEPSLLDVWGNSWLRRELSMNYCRKKKYRQGILQYYERRSLFVATKRQQTVN